MDEWLMIDDWLMIDWLIYVLLAPDEPKPANLFSMVISWSPSCLTLATRWPPLWSYFELGPCTSPWNLQQCKHRSRQVWFNWLVDWLMIFKLTLTRLLCSWSLWRMAMSGLQNQTLLWTRSIRWDADPWDADEQGEFLSYMFYLYNTYTLHIMCKCKA